jgi:hypothetical protein
MLYCLGYLYANFGTPAVISVLCFHVLGIAYIVHGVWHLTNSVQEETKLEGESA